MHRVLFGVLAICVASFPSVDAADWPMWRFDAGRSGTTPTGIAGELHLQWSRQLPAVKPAWPRSQAKLQFDRSYEPVVVGHRLFVGSSANDTMTAYDTRTGGELWTFFAEGPIRFAPVASQGMVYFVSDDGHLYCLDASDGRMIWKFHGGPADRRIIGNDRLISTWPARGGVVLHDDVLYFAAGIWPSMGIFIHAIDANTGQALWTNSKTGFAYTVHPHGASSFGSIVPQGYLAVAGDYLVVPGGRSMPGVFDLKTGKLVHFHFGGKSSGGFHVMAAEDSYWVGGELCRLQDGKTLTRIDADLLTREEIVSADGDELKIQSLEGERKSSVKLNRKGKVETNLSFAPKHKRSLSLAKGVSGKILCRAGRRIFFGSKDRIAAVELGESQTADRLEPIWSAVVEGTPTSIIAADDRLFVVTDAEKLFCFGGEKANVARHDFEAVKSETKTSEKSRGAARLIEACGVDAGYAATLGIGDAALTQHLLAGTNVRLAVIESDPERLKRFRRTMHQAGIYGSRTSGFLGDPLAFPFPPYFACLILAEEREIAEQLLDPKNLGHIFQSLRPYGGVLAISLSDKEHAIVEKLLQANRNTFSGGEIDRLETFTLIRRAGPIPRSGQWTHQYADGANSVVSQDQLVKAPLGVLWFGGPSNDKVLPRHGHGPSPQVAGGRIVIEGPDMLRAVDVYTGRLLWEKDLPGVGEFYNVTRHFSGAGEVGSNYVTLADRIYVIHEDQILELDAASGETVHRYRCRATMDTPKPRFGFIASAGDQLIATSSPVKFPGDVADRDKAVLPKGYAAIVKPHADWKYLAGSDPAKNWATIDFQDADWKTGPAGFGYGDGDDKTTISNMRGKFGRIYIRKAISGDDLENLADLTLKINYDDAFIAYWNGKEILRKGVGLGQGSDAKLVISHEAKGFETFRLASLDEEIHPGRNILAIEGHNTSLTSSDFTLDPFLIGRKSMGKEDAETEPKKPPVDSVLRFVDKSSSSKRLVVFDRNSREELWSRDAVYSFRHNGIAVTEDRIFCIDSVSPAQRDQLKRRGISLDADARLLALDARSGKVIWSTTENVFGTFLNYSAEHDVLLQAGSAYRDRAEDEVSKGMIAYRGTTGDVLWQDLDVSYSGPCLLWRDKIITNGSRGFQLGLLDGKRTDWTFTRMYGCNTVLGSEHLLTFRSGAAGFCDLTGDSGTGNLGGFRSSCTSNLIAADGVLSAPDYTRTCVCAYQNQTSVAWIHMPAADSWTFSAKSDLDSIERIGWNFGAPGDRRSKEGTLWLEYPAKGGPTPKLNVDVKPESIRWYSEHTSTVSGEMDWVAASGVEGVRDLTLDVPEALEDAKSWTVRLYFSEPTESQVGDRVFSIVLQGENVAKDFDILKAVGETRTMKVQEYRGIPTSSHLKISLVPSASSNRPPILSGVEVVPQK